MHQAKLFKPEPLKVVPRQGPAGLVVRRLAVWNSEGTLLRNVPDLVPGLNIIWSKDSEAAPGHDAGKTLFCRLLRYVLGDTLKDDVRERCVSSLGGDARVGAVVEIGGVLWSLARAIGRTNTGKVGPGTELDAVALSDPLDIRDPFRVLRDALADSIAPLDVEADWATLLATLTRDQAARLDTLSIWRIPTIGSEEERQRQLLKCLGLLCGSVEVDKEEKRSADSKRRSQAESQGFDRFRAQGLRKRLTTSLGIGSGVELDIPIVAEAFLKGAKGAVRDAKVGTPKLNEVTKTLQVLDQRKEALNLEIARVQIGQAEQVRTIELLRRSERSLKGTLLDLESARWTEDVGVCPTCQQPIGQPDARQKVRDEWNVRKDRCQIECNEIAGKIAECQKQVAALLVLEGARKQDLERLAEEIASTRREVEAERELQSQAIGKALRLQDDADEYAEIVARLQDPGTVAASAPSLTLRRVEREIEDDVLASRRRFQEIYSGVVQGIIGDEADAKVVFDGNHVGTQLVQNGQTYSVMQVLAFDISAMIMRVQGTSPGPAFLVHDSPRETDMSTAVYNGYLRLLHELEREVGPKYQAFVTMTSEPPKELLGRVRLELSGAPNELRLLRRAV